MVLQKNIKFDDLIIPRDTWISIPLVEIHHMEKYHLWRYITWRNIGKKM